jgi:chromosome segregation ATPase
MSKITSRDDGAGAEGLAAIRREVSAELDDLVCRLSEFLEERIELEFSELRDDVAHWGAESAELRRENEALRREVDERDAKVDELRSEREVLRDDVAGLAHLANRLAHESQHDVEHERVRQAQEIVRLLEENDALERRCAERDAKVDELLARMVGTKFLTTEDIMAGVRFEDAA